MVKNQDMFLLSFSWYFCWCYVFFSHLVFTLHSVGFGTNERTFIHNDDDLHFFSITTNGFNNEFKAKQTEKKIKKRRPMTSTGYFISRRWKNGTRSCIKLKKKKKRKETNLHTHTMRSFWETLSITSCNQILYTRRRRLRKRMHSHCCVAIIVLSGLCFSFY